MKKTDNKQAYEAPVADIVELIPGVALLQGSLEGDDIEDPTPSDGGWK